MYPIIVGNINEEAFCYGRNFGSSLQRRKFLQSRGGKNLECERNSWTLWYMLVVVTDGISDLM